MKFQVEEDTGAQFRYLPDRLRSDTGKQLAANLEHADKIRYLFRELYGDR